MGRLDANPDALRRHATLCDSLATELGSGTAPACPDSFQATAAAVAAAHGSFAIARSTVVDRMRSTAAAVQANADGLEAGEENSAARLRSRVE